MKHELAYPYTRFSLLHARGGTNTAARPNQSGGLRQSHFKSFKLPSGKEIKITGITKMDFPNSDPALVMSYLTDISIADKTVLRKEIDEIWTVFQTDVESAHLKALVIRATHVEGTGFVQNGKGYGFVFAKRDDGKWHCLEDDKP